MFKHILIPTDGSPVSAKTVKAGIALAKQTGAKVTGYYALEPVPVRLYGEGYVADRQMVAEFERRARQRKEAGRRHRAPRPRLACGAIRWSRRRARRTRGSSKRRGSAGATSSDGLARLPRPHAPDARQRHRQGHPALEDPGAGVPLGGCSSKPKRRSSSFSASSRNMKTAPQAITTVPSRKASGRVANQYCMIGA